MKNSFRVNRYGANLIVSVKEVGNEIRLTWTGTYDGNCVNGSGKYGMDRRDNNALLLEDETEFGIGSEGMDNISSAIDDSADFGKWAEYAMKNTP